MQRLHSHPEHRPASHGFTLLEIVLALGLTVLLMTGVYAALSLYWQYSTAGRDDVTRAQIARAVLDRMALDVRSVVYRDPSMEATPTEEEQAAEEEAAEQEIVITEPDAAYTGSNLGIIGDSTTLVLHISRPTRDMNYSSLLDGDMVTQRSSDLRSVSYFIAQAGGNGLQGAVGDMGVQERPELEADGGIVGLARMEGDRLAMDMADEQADYDTLAQGAQILAPEIVMLQFRYFDGVDWLDAWDSVAYASLPQAIEITIGFREDLPDADTPVRPSSSPQTAELSTSSTTGVYRTVVKVALAAPYVPEF